MVLEHPGLAGDAFWDDSFSGGGRFEIEVIDTEGAKDGEFDEGVIVGIVTMEAHRFVEGDGGVRD